MPSPAVRPLAAALAFPLSLSLTLALSLLVAVPAEAEPPRVVKIDDLTYQVEERVFHLAPSPRLPQPAAEGGRATLRGLGDGYAVCSTSDDAFPFDLSTSSPGSAIAMPGSISYPYDATLRPDGTEVWIADASDDAVIVIDRATDAVTQRIPVGDYPVSVVFSKNGAFALAICRDNSAGVDNIYKISTSTYAVLYSWVGPLDYLGPGNIALDAVSGNFYMVQWYDDFLHEVAPDGRSILRTVDVGTSLWQLVADPDGSTLYVLDRNTDQVRVIDRATLTQTRVVNVGDDPWGIDVTSDGARLYVACEDSQNVWVIDTTTWAATPLSVAPGDPRDVDVSPGDVDVFVAGGDSGSPDLIYVVDVATGTLQTPVSLPAGASNVNVVAAAPQPVPVELMQFSVE